MSTPPETCPHCGAEKRDNRDLAFFCGVTDADPMMRTATCYEREIAGLKSLLTDRPFPSCKHRFDFRGSRIYAYAPDGSFLWSSPPTFAVAECIRMEAELATLRDQLAAVETKWEHCREELTASRAECAALRSVLERAPEPVCAADSPRGYEKPHMVINFSALDRWWVVERGKALSIPSEALEAVRAAQGALKGQDEALAATYWTSDDGENMRDAEPDESGANSYVIERWKSGREALAKLNAAFGAGKEGGSR